MKYAVYFLIEDSRLHIKDDVPMNMAEEALLNVLVEYAKKLQVGDQSVTVLDSRLIER